MKTRSRMTELLDGSIFESTLTKPATSFKAPIWFAFEGETIRPATGIGRQRTVGLTDFIKAARLCPIGKTLRIYVFSTTFL